MAQTESYIKYANKLSAAATSTNTRGSQMFLEKFWQSMYAASWPVGTALAAMGIVTAIASPLYYLPFIGSAAVKILGLGAGAGGAYTGLTIKEVYAGVKQSYEELMRDPAELQRAVDLLFQSLNSLERAQFHRSFVAVEPYFDQKINTQEFRDDLLSTFAPASAGLSLFFSKKLAVVRELAKMQLVSGETPVTDKDLGSIAMKMLKDTDLKGLIGLSSEVKQALKRAFTRSTMNPIPFDRNFTAEAIRINAKLEEFNTREEMTGWYPGKYYSKTINWLNS